MGGGAENCLALKKVMESKQQNKDNKSASSLRNRKDNKQIQDSPSSEIVAKGEKDGAKKQATEDKHAIQGSGHMLRLPFPIYTLGVTTTKPDQKEDAGSQSEKRLLVAVGGGGGSSKSGIPNRLDFFYHSKDGFEHWASHDTEESAVMNMALHPKVSAHNITCLLPHNRR